MRLSTARKIAIARLLFRLISRVRGMIGLSSEEVLCRRLGAHWSLDLREGVQLALYLGLYEPATRKRLLECAPAGAVVIDVGANIGAHTLPLARAVGVEGRVIAVEPTDAAFARLLRNRELNPEIAERIVPVHAALGAPGDALQPAYYSAWDLDAAGERHPVHLGTRQSAATARFVTLDDLVESLALPTVTLMKIDVDGAELQVLAGARRMIARDHPTVVFEVCPYLLVERGQSAATLLTFFTSEGYQLLDERTMQPVGADTARILATIPEGGGLNLLARME